MSTLTQNLVSWWKFDESSGNTADSVGTNTLTNDNSVPFVSGLAGNGADFEDASNHSFSITDAAQTGLDITGDISFSFWFKPESAPSNGTQEIIHSKWELGSGAWDMFYEQQLGVKRVRFCVFTSAAPTVNINFTFPVDLGTGAFKHIVTTFTQSTKTVEMWVNGVSLGTVTDASAININNSSAPFKIGGGLGTLSTNGLDGIIDDFAVWSKVLLSSEIAALYNGGAGSRYPFINATSVTAETGSFVTSIPTISHFFTRIRNTSRPSSSMTNTDTVSSSMTNVTMSNTDSLWASRTAPWLLSLPWQSPVYGMTNVTKP